LLLFFPLLLFSRHFLSISFSLSLSLLFFALAYSRLAPFACRSTPSRLFQSTTHLCRRRCRSRRSKTTTTTTTKTPTLAIATGFSLRLPFFPGGNMFGTRFFSLRFSFSTFPGFSLPLSLSLVLMLYS
jgi:hypothetical protein